MRNGAKLFDTLFSQAESDTATEQKKGRSAELHAQKVNKLLNRYFFYGQHTNKRREVILETLELEFDLSARRINDILSENIKYLLELKKSPPTIKQLEKEFPYFNWNVA